METTPILEKNDVLKDKDLANIWHPYTQALTAKEPLVIDRARNASLFTKDGREIIDAISSWWVTLHGHCHPHINERIKSQLALFEHVLFADCTHEPAVHLSEKLLSLLPDTFSRLFYSDNGSTAVETALKIAFQYWFNQDSKTKRKKVIAYREGYHGDTVGAMSVSGRGMFVQPFLHTLFDVEYISPPIKGREEEKLTELRQLLSREDIASFIFEPLVQGAAGMKLHSIEGLDACIKLCHDHDVITIADEVMTGCGRTGPNFAIEGLNNTPNMICLSKGLTGGYLPLGVTVCDDKFYEKFLSKERSKAFLHGHSYCGNPLACVAAIASLELLESADCHNQRKAIQQQHEQFLRQWQDHPGISDSHVTGTILALEYNTRAAHAYDHELRDRLFKHFLSHNILMRPLGNRIYVIPPYCITKEQLQQVYQAIEQTLLEGLSCL